MRRCGTHHEHSTLIRAHAPSVARFLSPVSVVYVRGRSRALPSLISVSVRNTAFGTIGSQSSSPSLLVLAHTSMCCDPALVTMSLKMGEGERILRTMLPTLQPLNCQGPGACVRARARQGLGACVRTRPHTAENLPMVCVGDSTPRRRLKGRSNETGGAPAHLPGPIQFRHQHVARPMRVALDAARQDPQSRLLGHLTKGKRAGNKRELVLYVQVLCTRRRATPRKSIITSFQQKNFGIRKSWTIAPAQKNEGGRRHPARAVLAR